MARPTFPVTGDETADRLLVDDPFALLLGMLLDQQVPMEWAFAGPARLRERLDGRLDPGLLAALPTEEVEARFAEKPALHRFPGSMARRAQALAQHLVEHHGGDAAAVWRDAASGADLFARLRALPGFGEEKARIFVALLAKRFGVRPDGWEQAAGPFADDQPRSVADIDSREGFSRVRAWKQQQKARGKGKAD
ncbi:MAG: Fe-S cluster assembly protein HesB [Actinobacteria bacterium]|nr:Fe-S cluster assembly protein HesB [Actinomycetota bacterium]